MNSSGLLIDCLCLMFEMDKGLVYMVICHVLIFLLILGGVPWFLHLVAVIRDPRCKEWHFGNFNSFLKEFAGRSCEKDLEYSLSFFAGRFLQGSETPGYIHAGFIRFNKSGMVLYPWSYLRFLVWSFRKRAGKRNKGLRNEA